MPSMSGATTASTYSDSQKNASLSGKGKSSPTPASTPTAASQTSKNGNASEKKKGANNMERGNALPGDSAKAGNSGSETSQGSDNMGGGSSAIFSQGPKQPADAESSKGSQGDASTPAMPSMSGSTTASTYSDSPKHRSVSGRGASSKSGVTGNPTSSNQGSDNMDGSSSAVFSQGTRQAGGVGVKDSSGDASTPAVPSMNGSAAATTYAQRSGKRDVSGTATSGTSGGAGNSAPASSSASTDQISGALLRFCYT